MMTVKLMPFSSSNANRMNNMAQGVHMSRMYFGMFYIAGSDDNYMSSINTFVHIVFLLCVSIPSFVFIVYWLYKMMIEILLILT